MAKSRSVGQGQLPNAVPKQSLSLLLTNDCNGQFTTNKNNYDDCIGPDGPF